MNPKGDEADDVALAVDVAEHLNQTFGKYKFEYEARVFGGSMPFVCASRPGGYPFLRCHVRHGKVRAEIVGGGSGYPMVKLRRDVALQSLGRFLRDRGIRLKGTRLM